MAKRYTDSEKWKRPWFSDLTPNAKLVWLYILDDCDHCGTWSANFKRLSFDMGFQVSKEQFLCWLGAKVIQIEEDKYYIPSFVEFQYKELNASNPAHKRILINLERNKDKIRLALEGPSEDLPRTCQGSEDKDKVYVLKGGVGGKKTTQFDAAALYAKYPRKLGKSNGMKTFRAQIKTETDYQNLSKAIDIFCEHIRRENTGEDFIPYFSSFMNSWQDWLDPDAGSVIKPVVKSEADYIAEKLKKKAEGLV